MTVAIIGCVKSKRRGRHRAKDLYTSPLFKMAYRHATKHFDQVLILSAKHGLLSPRQYIESYNKTLKTMSAADQKAWARQVARQIRRRIPKNRRISFFCGINYWYPLIRHLDHPLHVPLIGLGLGQQMQWYKQNT